MQVTFYACVFLTIPVCLAQMAFLPDEQIGRYRRHVPELPRGFGRSLEALEKRMLGLIVSPYKLTHCVRLALMSEIMVEEGRSYGTEYTTRRRFFSAKCARFASRNRVEFVYVYGASRVRNMPVFLTTFAGIQVA